MNGIDLLNFLDSITYRFVSDFEEYKKLNAVKLFVNFWPDIESRSIMQDFKNMVDSKSYEYAIYMIREKYQSIKIKDDKEPFIETIDAKKIQYDLEKSLKRDFVKRTAHRLALNPDSFDELYIDLGKAADMSKDMTDYTVSGYLDKAIAKNEQEVKEGKSKIILPDFKIFSDQIGGFNAGRVSGISAKSGFGKTKLAVNIADSARKIMPVYYFNMEMTPEDFESQFIQKAGNVTYNEYKKGLSPDRFQSIIEYKGSFLETHDIVFTGGRSMSLDDICSRIAVSVKTGWMAIIDYDQKIISDSSGEEWQTMVRAMERLEDIAKSTGSHVIVLFQSDDDGFAKSSKRAIQPLSAFTHFTKDNDQFILKNIKNRFGKTGFEIAVDYWPETSTVIEKYLVDLSAKEILNSRSKLRGQRV